jgi:molecular chaperone IbpA
MRNFDFSPLYRSAIGFDRMANVLDSLTRSEQSQPSYPPYNIELTGDDKYRITMAVAGFSKEELNIEISQGILIVSGSKAADEKERTYLYQGIAARGFERRFQLADHVQVLSADYENGLLHVECQKIIPESLKPRRVQIGSVEKVTDASHSLQDDHYV